MTTRKTSTSKRPTPPRLMCSPAAMEEYEAEMVRQITVLQKLVGKTEFTDAVLRVAFRHADEITEELQR